MKAAIYANGSPKTGMGHIIRTMAIGEVLKLKHIEVQYICNSSSQECTEFIKYKNYKVLTFFLDNDKYDFIIVDSYEINSEEKLSYFYKFAKRVIYIDDLNLDYKYKIDILINYAVGAEVLNYSGVKLKLIGSEFMPLRKQFSNIVVQKPNEFVMSVLITMGAGDEFNYTQYILETLLEFYPDLDYGVILGMTNIHKEKLLCKFKNKKIQFYSNVENMASLMKNYDVAISAGGSTIYELCACSVPTIAIITACNQQRFIKTMNEKIDLPYVNFTKHRDVEFIDKFNRLYKDYNFRKKLSHNMNSLIDGNGTERIVDAIIKTLESEI